MGQATFNLQQMSNAIFTGGLKDALKVVLDSFNKVSPAANDLANILGNVLKGSIMALTFPIAVTVAGVFDLWNGFKALTGMSDDMSKSLVSLAANLFGVYLAFKLVKKVAQVAGIGKAAKDLMSGDVSGKSSRNGRSGKFGKNTASSVGDLMGRNDLRLFAAATAISAVMEHGSKGGSLSATNLFGSNSFTDFLDTPIQDMFKSNGQGNGFVANSPTNPLNLNIKLGVDVDQQGNIVPMVKAISRDEAIDVQNESYEQMQNSLGGYN